MADIEFSVADFFRLGNEAAAHESALRLREADARAEIRIKLARAGLADQDSGVPSPDRTG